MRLSEQDASFLYTETASAPMQTAGILVAEGELSFEEVYNFYASRIHLVPRLRQRLVFVPMNLAHPVWAEDPNFDVSQHIVHHPLPPGSTMEEGLAALCELNEGVMDRDIPLWKFFVVTGVKDRTLVLQQMHHAMVDGASTVQMATVLFDYEQNAEPVEPEKEPWNPPPLPTPQTLMAEAVQDNIQASMAAMSPTRFGDDNQWQSRLSRAFETMSKFVTRPCITAPWNAAQLGPKRHITSTEHPFSEFREIRRAFGGTINDVALAVVTEGAARYLEKKGEAVGQQEFRMMCPVNVRTEDESGGLGNRVSAIFPMSPARPLGIRERLDAMAAETAAIKNNQEAQAMTFMQESSFPIPPVGMLPLLLVGTAFDPTRFAADYPLPVPPAMGARAPLNGVNFVLTNVPGVQVPQYICGKEIISTLAIMMMGGNMGLGIAVASYNQRMFFNFTADPRLLPDLDMFTDQISGVFVELLELAKQKNAASIAA